MSVQVGCAELLFVCRECETEAEATAPPRAGYREPEDLDKFAPEGWEGDLCPECCREDAREAAADNAMREGKCT